MLLALAFAIGVVAGLRSMTPPAVVAWFAQSQWPDVRQSYLSFMGAAVTAWAFTALALAELVADKLPFVPSRLSAGPLGGRILSGALSAAVLCAGASESVVLGATVGAIGAVSGAFAGYAARTRLAGRLRVPPLLAALTEDVIAVAGAIAIAAAL
jgi:uncharacterized membrane protein